jgi:uncharacterized protein YjbI with pentapeptide repeats
MKQIVLLGIVISIVLLSSCRKDFSTIPSSGNLEFSKDTVYLDTIFSQIGSSTYSLKVYNKTNEDLTIPSIRLATGDESGYRLNVDGVPGKSFKNVDILAKDSIYVFIETTVDVSTISDPLYIDEILFDSGDNQQDVKLVTLVQDAHFLFPNKTNGVIETLTFNGVETTIKGRYLTDEELSFTDDKPYVIYGYMMVGSESDEPKVLTVEAGANIHFHANSGLFVNKNSSIQVHGTKNIEGEPQTEVIFQGDRLEPEFENAAGQWGNIILLPESQYNYFNYATIKNGTIGIIAQGIQYAEVPVLELYNTQIYNFSLFGILGIHTNITGVNLAINNCGVSDFSAMVGGVYNFTHCSFPNSWSQPRSSPNIWLLDSNSKLKSEDEDLVTADFYQMNFTNCILGGSRKMELIFDQESVDTEFNMHFSNNLIQFNDTNHIFDEVALYDFTNTDFYTDNIFNADADFLDLSLNKLNIGEESFCIGQAKETPFIFEDNLDILGRDRVHPSDIGAYVHEIFEEE